MLDEDTILKLSKNILKRYEHNLQDGVLFLYDVETEELWTGNSSSNEIVKLINGERSLKDIYTALKTYFAGYDEDVIKDSINSVINDLINKNFIEILR